MADIVSSRDGKVFVRKEVVRLMAQALTEMGYAESSQKLQHESGIAAESDAVDALKKRVHDGEWLKAIEMLNQIRFISEDKQKRAVALLLRERFYDLVQAGKKLDALKLLRGQLSQYHAAPDELKQFTSALVCNSRPAANGTNGVVDGATPSTSTSTSMSAPIRRQSRQGVITTLEAFISPSECVPTGRLLSLLSRAVDVQRRFSVRESNEPCSLLGDRRPIDLPRKVYFKVKALKDEVWLVEFSHNGRYLAAAGRSRTVRVLDCHNKFSKRLSLSCHPRAASIAWSPDDSKLAVGCEDTRAVFMWDVRTGGLASELTHHTAGPCIVSFGNKRAFATCSSSEGRVVYFQNASNLTQPTKEWRGLRGIQMAFTPDDDKLVVAGHDRKIHILDLSDFSDTTIPVKGSITSLKLSKDGRHVLINTCIAVLQVFELHTRRLEYEYSGHAQTKYMIRSCFGANDKFILSGSEDGRARIWHRDTGRIVATLTGHDGVVNDVAWHPHNPFVVVTAGDDHRVFVWGPPRASRGRIATALKQSPDSSEMSLESNGEAEADGVLSGDDMPVATQDGVEETSATPTQRARSTLSQAAVPPFISSSDEDSGEDDEEERGSDSSDSDTSDESSSDNPRRRGNRHFFDSADEEVDNEDDDDDDDDESTAAMRQLLLRYASEVHAHLPHPPDSDTDTT